MPNATAQGRVNTPLRPVNRADIHCHRQLNIQQSAKQT